jgi:Lysozyme like domain
MTHRLANGQFTDPNVTKMLNGFFILIGACMTALAGFFYAFPVSDIKPTFISPVGAYSELGTTPTPTPNPIEQEIRNVFGEYADQAIEIAKCESKLDPKAFNDNTTWGGVGRDKGIFQISDYYHPAANKFYYDYKVNIAMAYKIFRDAGNSWQPWTCKYILNK